MQNQQHQNMNLLVCLSLQVYIDLPEDQEYIWMNKNRVKMEVTEMMDQTLMRRTMIFIHTTTIVGKQMPSKYITSVTVEPQKETKSMLEDENEK